MYRLSRVGLAKLAEELLCGDCGGPMFLKFGRYGPFYGCGRYPDCKGVHTADAVTHAPLGVPANAEMRKARVEAHAAFDAFWKRKGWKRGKGYAWLQEQLNLPGAKCHIGQFDLDTCVAVVKAVENYRE